MSRAPYAANDRDRGLVEAHVACGTPETEIASILRLDPKTLRKYYAHEIANARHSANAAVAGSLFKMALGKDGQKPNVIACIFWLKTRARWREVDEHPIPTFDYSRLPPKERRELHRLLTLAQRPNSPTDKGSAKLTVAPGDAVPDAED